MNCDSNIQNKVKETEYYTILGVNVDAQNVTIKRSYHAKAIIVHPDKNLGDPQAQQQFEKLAEAYQILSNPEMRKIYNAEGKEGKSKEELQKRSRIHPTVVFGMLYGSEFFKDYIGTLALASLASIVSSKEKLPRGSAEFHLQKFQEFLKPLQNDREDKLIAFLKNCLNPFVAGQTQEFESWGKSVAVQLSKVAFGEVMLHTIGYIYTRKVAREFRKDTQYMKVPVLVDWVQDIDPSQLMAAKGAASYIHLLEEGRELNQGVDKINVVKACMDKKDHMITTLWRINVIDIESTLSRVCQAVLKDPNASNSVLASRGKALEMLGDIFQGAKTAYRRKNSLRHESESGDASSSS